ncbi:acyltransferase family protein [Anaerocolumna sp. MB42-C2]|uniref:acyltransferase family protein n=1 Tax=Anaerocolumna sp. MB42-C2 TaxID=3070997 RepID=UPI0027DFDC63|nr:acyltransferase [Anaerocolumna sp. MB42-C2]WMJ90691.1 acyltransferase [Anaerocolumna sp. MB42-C2]
MKKYLNNAEEDKNDENSVDIDKTNDDKLVIEDQNCNNKKENINFISVLRVLAIVSIMWGNMVPFILNSLGYDWYPLQFVRYFITNPLAIMQDFNSLGVMIFFLCSGFIITYTAQRESLKEFIIKRIFRIYPGLIFSVISLWIIQRICTLVTGEITYWGSFGVKEWIYGGTLGNYFIGVPNVINGVTWTLIIGVMFYILCGLTYYFLKTKPLIEILLMMAICMLSIITASSYGRLWYGVASSVSYMVILIFGQILYYYWSKRITLRTAAILLLINYYIFIKKIAFFSPEHYVGPNYMAVSFMYAFFLFIIGILINDKIRLNKTTKTVDKISYSLYLNHLTLSQLLIPLLYKNLGYDISLLITLGIVVIISVFQYKCVELPSNKLAKKLSKYTNT